MKDTTLQEIFNIALKEGWAQFEITNHPTEGTVNFLIVPIRNKKELHEGENILKSCKYCDDWGCSGCRENV